LKETKTDIAKTDLLIIGAGPAGLGAAIYAARLALDFKIVEKFMAGGQIITTEYIENYPGFKDNISGYDLMQNIIEHCRKFNVTVEENFSVESVEFNSSGMNSNKDNRSGSINDEKNGNISNGSINVDNISSSDSNNKNNEDKNTVKKSDISKNYKFLVKGQGAVIIAKSLIIATGTSPKRLFVEGESEFIGKGISYCATCDGALYRDREVMVVGGGNTAVQEALFLTKFARIVYIVHRRGELRAVKLLQKRAFENPKIKFIWDSVIEKFSGRDRLGEVLIKNVKTGKEYSKKIDGVFEYIGIKPNSELVRGIVELDIDGFIITDSQMQTSIAGLFAAGDVRNTALRQVITAVADGAVAATHADKFLNN